MSSILKALKKLDAEKALHEEVAGINVSREILRQQPIHRNTILWLWIGGIAAFTVIATLAALLLAKPSQQQGVKAAPATAVSPGAAGLPPAAGAIMPVTPVSTGGRTVTAPPAPPEERHRQQISPAVPPPSLPAINRRSTTEMPASHFPVAQPPQAESGRKQLLTHAPDQAEASLTLSGIAWNKDSADRLAIINGQPTATGAIVSGVVVEEILPDRVKVNSDGRSFEIFLGKPAKSN